MVRYGSEELAAYFHDLDSILSSAEDSAPIRSGCANCSSLDFCYSSSNSSYPGSRVCNVCGAVEKGNVYFETMYNKELPCRSSNYKRIHHWHERISQMLLMESRIPNEKMLLIAEKLCDGTYSVLNKDIIRSVLRSLKMQPYIEKWLQIIQRITGIAPPVPGVLLIRQLDTMFIELQRPFEAV